MNKSDTPTKQKVSIPLRLPPELYEQMMELIHERKKEERGYIEKALMSTGLCLKNTKIMTVLKCLY